MFSIHKYKTCFLIIVILTSFITSACAFKDIDKRAFVVGIGIDPAEKNESGYKVTLKIAIPVGAIKETTAPEYAYLSEENDRIGEAIRMLETQIDKVLEFGHAKIIVISNKLLTENHESFMDYFTRRGDIQLIAYVATTKELAEDILKVEPDTESTASISLYNFFDGNGTESPFIVTTFLFQYRRDYHGEGINPVLPLLESRNKNTELAINKALVIKENDEKPLELTPTETKYFNTLVNGANGFSYKIKKGDLELMVNVESIRMHYKIITEQGAPPRLKMTINKTGVIGESNQELLMNNLDKYDKIIAEEMKKKVLDLLETLQEHEVDPFGFGLRYRATRLNTKNTISEWESIYPNLKFDVAVNMSLKSTGAIE